ncbi:CapA family protein [Spirulina sp. CS-785/01]|uniref:CapA family protein n=1 Tax=Spirulina sp. CS-785/01 TaxID=3021716 RepID=UPI00232CA997|nr:CapA family protein [Spirulina sp. CS-785/01]MDB9312656.1 CapA family protein [Spirulina sp. CS-785/01]
MTNLSFSFIKRLKSSLSFVFLCTSFFIAGNWHLTSLAQIDIYLNLPETLEPPPPEFIPPTLPTITIKAVGDTILGTNYPAYQLPANPASLFQNIQSYLTEADFVFGNFESTITNYPHSAKTPVSGRVYAFRSPPEHAQILSDAGFNILSVANNHSYDFTLQGFQDTMQNLENVGIEAVGEKGQIVYTKVNGITVAWIGFSYLGYHNSINNLNQGRNLVNQAQENAEIIIISVHGGAEGRNALRTRNQTEIYLNENRGNMVNFSRAMINHGADLILGHGPHVPRALELHENRLIAYSLGNFIGYRTLNTSGENGYSLILEVELDETGNFLGGTIIPLRLSGEGVPRFDPENRTIQLIRRLTQSDFPNTPLLIQETGEILPES